MKKAREKALAWAARLEQEAALEWERRTGRGSSRLPAHVRHRLVDSYHQLLFAAEQFRKFAKTELGAP